MAVFRHPDNFAFGKNHLEAQPLRWAFPFLCCSAHLPEPYPE
jgi:hypothetical protein